MATAEQKWRACSTGREVEQVIVEDAACKLIRVLEQLARTGLLPDQKLYWTLQMTGGAIAATLQRGKKDDRICSSDRELLRV